MKIHDTLRLLEPELEPLGFKRQKYTWNRKIRNLTDVVNVQLSKSGDSVTVNAGVSDPDIYRTCWDKEPPNFVQEEMCIVRVRVGQLIDGRDRWWRVDSEGEINELVRHVVDLVPPFLESMHRPHKMVEWLCKSVSSGGRYPPPVIYLAALKRRLGEREEACSLLAAIYDATTSAWQERLTRVQRILDCK